MFIGKGFKLLINLLFSLSDWCRRKERKVARFKFFKEKYPDGEELVRSGRERKDPIYGFKQMANTSTALVFPLATHLGLSGGLCS